MKIRYDDLCAKCHRPANGHTVGVFDYKGDTYATLEEIRKNLFNERVCKFMPNNLKYLEDLYEKKQKGEKV